MAEHFTPQAYVSNDALFLRFFFYAKDLTEDNTVDTTALEICLLLKKTDAIQRNILHSPFLLLLVIVPYYFAQFKIPISPTC